MAIRFKKFLNACSLFILGWVIIGCSNYEREDLYGPWTVEGITHGNDRVPPGILKTTLIGFKKNECILPITDFEHKNTDKQIGQWEVTTVNDSVYLHIRSSNEIFGGKFSVTVLGEREIILNKYVDGEPLNIYLYRMMGVKIPY